MNSRGMQIQSKMKKRWWNRNSSASNWNRDCSAVQSGRITVKILAVSIHHSKGSSSFIFHFIYFWRGKKKKNGNVIFLVVFTKRRLFVRCVSWRRSFLLWRKKVEKEGKRQKRLRPGATVSPTENNNRLMSPRPSNRGVTGCAAVGGMRNNDHLKIGHNHRDLRKCQEKKGKDMQPQKKTIGDRYYPETA